MDLKATLNVVVDATGARSGVEAANRAFDQLKRRGEDVISGLDSNFKKLKDSVFSLQTALIGLATGALAKSFLDAGRETENYMIRLQVLLGSVEKGKQLFKDMNLYAAQTPFTFREVMGAATTLAAVLKGGNSEIKAFMPLIGDLAAASGLSIQEATGQVVKMLSAGASAADMFRERGINAMLGFQTGVQYSASKTREMLIKAYEDPASKFRGTTQALVNTWDGAMSNLEDAWFQFQQRVMVDGGVLTYLKSIVQVLTDDFTKAFGASTNASETFAKNTITGLEVVVRGIGAVIEASKFAIVAFEALKTASQGFASSWALIAQKAASARAELARMTAEGKADQLEGLKRAGASQEDIDAVTKQYRAALEDQKQANLELSSSYKAVEQAQGDNEKQLDELFGAYKSFQEGVNLDKFLDDVNAKFAANNAASDAARKKLEGFKSGLLGMGAAGKMSQQDIDKLNETLHKATDFENFFKQSIAAAAGESDRAAKAWADYGKNIDDINEKGKEWIEFAKKHSELGISETHISEMIAKAKKAEAQARDDNLEKIQKENDLTGEYLKQLKDQDSLVGLQGKALAVAQAVQDITKSWDGMDAAWKRTHPLAEIVTQDFKDQVAASYDLHDAYDKMRQVQEEYAGHWADMFNSMAEHSSQFFTGQIKSWKDFGRAILGDVVNLVQQLIFQWMKLQFVNPLLNSMFGGMMNLPTMANGGGGMGMMGQMMGMMGGGTGSAAGSTAGGGGLMSNLSSLYTMGSNFFGGGTGLAAAGPWAGSAGMVGPYVPGAGMGSMGFVPDYAAGAPMTYGAQPAAYNPMGGYTNIGGWQASTAGLMGAGVGLSYGLKRGDGGLGTVGSAAAGAVGGYALGSAVGAGAGVMMAGGGAAAAGSAALAAIPVVGWIALAALVIDKISGGKLFGTRFKPKEMTTNLSISQDGSLVTNTLLETRQGALFSGLKKRTKDIAVTDEQQSGANELFEQAKQTMTAAAARFGIEVPAMIEASFKTVTEYTKKGKVKGTKTSSMFGGVSYDEDYESFQKRVNAESIIKVLSQIDASADAVAGKYRKNAADLLDAATAMGAIVEDIRKGDGLLGAASKLGDVVDVVDELKKSGEGLADAYSRLTTLTKGFKQILEAMSLDIGRTGADLVRLASDIGDAAGGADKASALFNSFYQNYFSEDEKKKQKSYGFQQSVMKEVGDLGDAGQGLSFANFRERFEKALPKLNASQIKEWLEAGDALAQLAGTLGTTKTAVSSAREALDAYGKTFSDFSNVQVATLKTANQQMTESMYSLLANAQSYDGSIESESKLIGMIQDRYAMEMSYLSMIKNIQDGINDSLGSQIESLKLSKLDDEGKYDYFKKMADSLSDSLMGMTDPEEIAKTVSQINQYEQSAYNTLSPEQQALMVDDFIKFLQGIQDVANEKLEGAKDNVKTQSETISEAIETALTRVAEKQQQAADKQDQAADKILEAASTPQPIDVRVTLVGGGLGGRAEVGGL